MDTATKTGLDALKTASKNVIHKAAEATGEFSRNRVANNIAKPDENSRNVEQNNYSIQKEKKNNELRQVL